MQQMHEINAVLTQPIRAIMAVSLLRAVVRYQTSFATGWPMLPPRPAPVARIARCGTSAGLQPPFAIDMPSAPAPRRPRAAGRRLATYQISPHLLRTLPRLAVTRPFGRRLTPLMAELERILCRIAETGGEIPNNPLLGERCGGRGRSSIDRALRRLAGTGRILIENDGNRRRIYVEAVDAYTDWGEARPGHAPYCRNEKQTDPTAPPPAAPLPMLSGLVTLPPLPSMSGFTYPVSPVSTAPHSKCQFPLWGDWMDATGAYCGADVAKPTPQQPTAASFCPAHRAMVFQPMRRRRTCENA